VIFTTTDVSKPFQKLFTRKRLARKRPEVYPRVDFIPPKLPKNWT